MEGGKRFLAAVLPLRSGRRGIQNGDVRSDKFSANVPRQVSLLAFGMISCASRSHDKSPEGTGISWTGSLEYFVFRFYLMLQVLVEDH